MENGLMGPRALVNNGAALLLTLQDPAQALIITTLTDVPDTTFTIDTSQQVSGYPYLCGCTSQWFQSQ
jgi:hypothetical protein